MPACEFSLDMPEWMNYGVPRRHSMVHRLGKAHRD
jgi:hypothetical protein